MSAMMQRQTSSFLSPTFHIMEWSYVESQANLVPILRSFPKTFRRYLPLLQCRSGERLSAI